ncbi:MAG: sensor histidine kinase [Burkholderiales bacterium]|nr:sensor histidine kinase [Bacteroidia bacterium]
MKFLTCLIICVPLITLSQSHKTDSLLKVYASSTADSNKVNALNNLFAEYRYSDEILANKYANQAIDFSSKANLTKGYALALYNKGAFESEHGNFDSSDIYIKKSLIQYQKLNNQAGIATCKMAFGFNMYDKSNFTQALVYFIEASKINELINDLKGQAGANIWVGNIYNTGLNMPKLALPYYEKALKIQESIKDENGMSFTYNNLGNVYCFLQKYPESLQNHFKSAELKEKLNNKKGLSASYDNIGNVYFDLLEFTKAEDYYIKALAIREEFGDKKGMNTSYVNIGNLYIKQKKYKEAIDIHSKALASAKEINNKETMKEASNSLSASYEAIGDFKKALEYTKYSALIKDSIINSTFTEQISEMQTKYDVEKKDIEIAKNKAELKAKEEKEFIKNIITSAIFVLLILLFLVGFLFYRKKQIEHRAKLDAEIASQKDTRTKAILDAEEKERRRIAQDLHDGVGQLLSAAKLNLSNLESKLTNQNEDQKTAMDNALSLIDDSVKEVRSVSHNMMPNTLIKLGLGSAVREFITKLSNTPSLKIDLEIIGLDQRLDNQLETVLYRVIQEIVNNIIKHAKASQISMQLVRHETEINVMVEDNGVGFDASSIDTFEGIGLKGIITRIEFLDGSVHFDSNVGRGTTVIIDVPL